MQSSKLPAFIVLLVGILILPVVVLGFHFGLKAPGAILSLFYVTGFIFYIGIAIYGFKKPKLLFAAPLGIALMVAALWFDGALWQDHTTPIKDQTPQSEEVAPNVRPNAPTDSSTNAVR